MATAMSCRQVLSLVAAKAEQRRHPRYEVDPMYTSVTAERTDGGECDMHDRVRPEANRLETTRLETTRLESTRLETTRLEGHAYDISLGGMRFELDEALPAGARVAVEVALPGCVQPIRATARVVRVFSAIDDPGPRRMAVEFETFLGASRDTLSRHIAQGWLRPARGRTAPLVPSALTAPIDEGRDLFGDVGSIAG